MGALRLTIFVLLTFRWSYSTAQTNPIFQKDSAITADLQKNKKSLSGKRNKADSATELIVAKPLQQIGRVQNKVDSTALALSQLPIGYFKRTEKKINTYSNRITSKTEKTLTKLSRWENKIHQLLKKASPETDERLFGEGKVTFTSLLTKIKNGENIVDAQKARYSEYTDKLNSSIKYIDSKRSLLDSSYIQPISKTAGKVTQLNQDVANTEAVEDFIKERHKQLINESVKYIGKSKYFKKINKESYYYVETLKNYKQIFSDPDKAEETALNILHKIPAFEKFAQQNSMLSSLFGTNAGSTDMQALAGLQSRAGINDLLQGRVAAGGPNAAQLIQANMNEAKNYITDLKNKVAQVGGSNSDVAIPDFKPNEQKTKTFLQRLEYGTSMQSQKAGKYFPVTTDIALSVGYKLNDKNIIGIGASYKLGLGSGFDNIHLSSQGISIRAFMDWKIKKTYYLSGGYEQNYRPTFTNTTQLRSTDNWQQSGLIGFSKKFKLNKKLKGNLQLLYDFLYKTHYPSSQPIVYRVGYNF